MHPGIPSEDIIWQNIANLKQESKCSSFVGLCKTVLASSFAIFGITSLECLSLHFIPTVSPAILYITSTVYVLFCYLMTPYLVFRSIQRERYA